MFNIISKNLFMFLFLLASLILVYGCSREASKKLDPNMWESFGVANLYYNKKNITRSAGSVSVWTYEEITEDRKKDRIEILKKISFEDQSEKYKNYDHEEVLFEMDCKNKKFRMKRGISYDAHDKILSDTNVIDPTLKRPVPNYLKWINISPESIAGKLYDKVCVAEQK